MPFDMQDIENSSNIAAYGYDADQGILRVRFHTGRQYDCGNVTPELHQAFAESPSKGKFFAQSLRDRGVLVPSDLPFPPKEQK